MKKRGRFKIKFHFYSANHRKRLLSRGISALIAVAIFLPMFTWLASLGTFTVSAATTLNETNCHIDASGVITWYGGADTNITVPAAIGGATVTGIDDGVFMSKGLTSITFLTTDLSSIGKQAFQDNALTSVAIPDTVTTIGEQAFFNNQISSLTLSTSLETMGKYAFRNNRLTSVTLPATLTELPEGAFMQNPDLSQVNLNAVTKMGDSAFSGCHFDTVTLPSGLTAYGNNVFANNRRYVLVSGSSLATTYSVAGQFGEIAGEIRTLTVKYQDMEGNKLLEDKTYTSNRDTQVASTADLVVDGNVVTVALPTILGYNSVSGASKSIVILDDTTLIAKYLVDGDAPAILGLDPITVAVGGTVDLRTGVTAVDYRGNDLTASIEITPSTIDTSAPRGYVIKYTVRDADGRITTAYRDVLVGADPMKMEIGLGWLYEDFTYSTDGTQLTGLSASGEAKFAAGNTTLMLPGKCPKAANGAVDVPITSIASGTTSSPTFKLNFTYISFQKMTSLVTISSFAFSSSANAIGNALTAVDMRGCVSLRTIDTYAFHNAQLTSLDLSECVSLQTFGNSVFGSSALTELDLNKNTALKTIGNSVFESARLTELDLSGCIALQSIGIAAFGSSSLTKLDLSGCTALQSIGNNAFQVARLTELDLSKNTALRSIGDDAFYLSELTELDLSKNTLLTYLGGFHSARLTKLDLSKNTALRTIGSFAFAYSPLTELNLSGCAALITIGDYAFQVAGLTNLDLSGCTALQTIGYRAFLSSKLTELDLSRCAALKTIDPYAFQSSPLTELDLSGCTALQWIGDYAFYRSTLTELDLSGCTALRTIGSFAFAYSPLTEINLNGCAALQTIGNNAFDYARLTALDLSECIALQDIGFSAFASSPIIGLDLRNNIKLTAIESNTFGSIPDNSSVYLSDNVSALHLGAFGTGITWVYTTTAATALTEDSYDNIYVNKIGYYIEALDNSGHRISLSSNSGLALVVLPMSEIGNPAADIGRQIVVMPPSLHGYTSPTAQSLTLDGTNQQVVQFIYTKSAQIVHPALTVSIKNANPNRYRIQSGTANAEAQIEVSFSASGDLVGSLPAGSEIVIPFYDSHINMSTLRMGTTSVYIQSWHVEGRELHLVLNEIVGGDAIESFPILFKFYNDGSVPYEWEATFDAFVVDGSTQQTVASSNPATPARVIGYFTKGTMTARVQNFTSTTGAATSRTIDVGDDTDVYLGWTFSYAIRNFESMQIIYDIPTYVNEAGQTVYAQFIPENNPAWVVTATNAQGNPTQVTLNTAYDTSVYGTPGESQYQTYELSLRFPNAKGNQQVNTSVAAVLTPAGATQHELDIRDGTKDSNNLFYLTATNNFYISDTKPDPWGDIIRVDKYAYPQARQSNGSVYGDNHGEFYDNDDNSGVFEWDVKLNINSPKYIGTNAVLHDYDLDPRMYYYGVSGLSKIANEVEIVAYDAAGNELCREISAGDSFIFDPSIQKNIAKVDFFFLGEFTKSAAIRLQTKLRNPDITVTGAQSSGGVDFYNYAMGEFDADLNPALLPEGTTSIGTHAQDSDYSYWKILHLNETLQATKTNSFNGWLFCGDYLTYTVGVSGQKINGSSWSGFALLDMLPDCVELVNVRMSDEFASIPGAKVEVISNYNGSGLTGVLFTVESPNKFTCPVTGYQGNYQFRVGYIEVKIGNLYDSQGFTNNVYAKVDASTGVQLLNTVTAANSYNLNGTGSASRAYVQNGYLNIRELGLRKTIRNISGDNTAWTSSGIITEPGEQFEYKLTIHNATTNSVPDGIVYDIFPSVGDTYIDKQTTASATNIPRNSQFANTFVSASAPAGWTVYYTDDPGAENTRAFYASAEWKTAAEISDFSKVTGVKFVAGAGVMIPAESNVDFVIRMQAPSDESLVGQRANNSASYITNWVSNPNARELECNAVYNEIRQYGSVSLRKVDENNNPLAGATFQILDASNKIVGTQRSDANGMVVFKDLVIGNYTIKEISAPAGYEPITVPITISAGNMIVNGTYHHGDIRNTPTPPPPEVGSVKLTKNSEAGTALRSVQFRITGLDAGVNDDIVITKATNTLGQVTFHDLPLGNYKIEELQTSNLGYLEATYTNTFKLTSNGQVIDLGTILNNTAAVTLVKIGLFSAEYQALPNNELDAAMGAKLSGIAFELWDDRNTNVTSLHTANNVTNTSGQITFTGLELGRTYTLKEILTAAQQADYVPRGSGAGGNEYTFSVGVDGKLTFNGEAYDKQNLIIGNNVTDTEYKALLRKVDQNGDPLAGVEFQIKAAGVSTPQSLYTDINGEILLTKSGLETLFGAGVSGKFTITEVKAPLGYAKSFGPDSVWEINWNNPEGYDEITFVNQEITLNIHKYSKVASTVYETLQYLNLTELLDIYGPETTLGEVSLFDKLAAVGAAETAGLALSVNDDSDQWELRIPLAGAEFTVTQVSDPGNTFTAVTNADGSLSIPAGFVIDEDEVYEVKETAAPAGYQLNDTALTFKVSDLKQTGGSGHMTYSNGAININLDNEPLTGSITVTKLDKYKGTVIAGVGFTLYDGNGNKVATAYTDINGVAVFSGLPVGVSARYTLKETDPMPGYEADPTEYEFTLTSAEGNQYQYITLRNETIIKYSRLTITKVNEEGRSLPGIEFYLMYSGDGGATWDDYLDTHEKPYYFTNSEGKLVFDHLPAGIYKIVEITQDPQYGRPIYSPSDIFIVPDDKELDIQITVVNPNVSTYSQTTLSLKGIKTLMTEDGVAVPIADGEFLFTLTPAENNPAGGCTWGGRNPVSASAGGTIDFGILTFTTAGTYLFTIREVVPDAVPAGWVYDTDDVTVTAVVENDNGQLKIASTTYSKAGKDVNGISFVNKCGIVFGTDSTLIITKVDSAGTPLSGMEFYLMVSHDGGTTWADYGTTHIAPSATNAFGKLVFRELPAGMYKIVEITNNPAYGPPVYSPSDTFTILEDETLIVEITVVNPLIVPHTGDPFRLGQWVVLCAAAVIGIIVPIVFRRRRKNS